MVCHRLGSALSRLGLPLRDRNRAILVMSALVGGLALARATEASDRALSDEILAAVRDEITKLPRT